MYQTKSITINRYFFLVSIFERIVHGIIIVLFEMH